MSSVIAIYRLIITFSQVAIISDIVIALVLSRNILRYMPLSTQQHGNEGLTNLGCYFATGDEGRRTVGAPFESQIGAIRVGSNA